jgi:hypothetical protein
MFLILPIIAEICIIITSSDHYQALPLLDYFLSSQAHKTKICTHLILISKCLSKDFMHNLEFLILILILSISKYLRIL